MSHDDDDIACMRGAWPSSEVLTLCADPAGDVGSVTGQPLQSIESFTQSFRALKELSLYLNTLHIDVISGIPANSPQSRLSVLDPGTSPIPTDDAALPGLSAFIYVTSMLELDAKIKSERSVSHAQFLQTSPLVKAEYSRCEKCWSKCWSRFVTKVHIVLSTATGFARE
ncbi:hypothetical protein FRB98_009165, partial [Tulasnella sp. 332]